MSPRGGPRPGSGRKRTTGRTGGPKIVVLCDATEHATITAALRPTETPAGFLRAAGMREAMRRSKRKGRA